VQEHEQWSAEYKQRIGDLEAKLLESGNRETDMLKQYQATVENLKNEFANKTTNLNCQILKLTGSLEESSKRLELQSSQSQQQRAGNSVERQDQYNLRSKQTTPGNQESSDASLGSFVKLLQQKRQQATNGRQKTRSS
jgi:hypothetical protein